MPANAEIVLEGYVEQGDLAPEGPFGDHTGYYTAVEPFPVFHVTAITMRRDAIYPSIVVGKPPQEDAWLGKATERIFLPAIRMSVPELVDYDLPVAGAFHNCCIVSIRKRFPGHAQKVMHAIWGLGLLSLTKSVVVVDEWVDVHDYEEVFFRVGANVDPKRDVLLTEGPLDHLDHAPTLQFYGGKLGIDATHKGPERGDARVAAGDRDERRGARPRDAPLGRVRDRARSRCTERANASECRRRAVWCVVDRGTESRPWNRTRPHLPGSEPLADRLRDRRGMRPRRARSSAGSSPRSERRSRVFCRDAVDPRRDARLLDASGRARAGDAAAVRRPARPRPPTSSGPRCR